MQSFHINVAPSIVLQSGSVRIEWMKDILQGISGPIVWILAWNETCLALVHWESSSEIC